MALSICSAVAQVRRSGGDHPPLLSAFEDLCRQAGHRWRERLLPPLVTLRLLLLQILNGNTAITHLRQLSGLDFSPASYCDARRRLPLAALQALLGRMIRMAAKPPAPGGGGGRILLVDGSSASMPDTPSLRKRFGMPAGQKEGVGYPVCSIMGMLDLATGMFKQMLVWPLCTHDQRGVIGLHESLEKGDILVGDRAFCSVCHFALLNVRGVFGCFRLHQRRPTGKLGWVRWPKPAYCPDWMSLETFETMPAFVDVRLVRHWIERPGYRTKVVYLATTLTESMGWDERRLADLYARRWEIETCFGHLKTTMGMGVVRCRTVDGVLKELCVHLIVYNLARLLMLEYAEKHGVDVRRVSFVDALRHLGALAGGLEGVERLVVNPERPGRSEPRAIRRRGKSYPWLTSPRKQWKSGRKKKQNA